MQAIAEHEGVTPDFFRETILAGGQPAVLRGLVADWPAVGHGNNSPAALAAYLKRLDAGKPVDFLAAPPEVAGDMFYREDMRGFNFDRSKQRISTVLDALIAHIDNPAPPTLSMQSMPVEEGMPAFARENPLPLPQKANLQRLWIGNKVSVAPHFDLYENIACVVAGRRRFTLFPPEQLPNLYVGPFDFSPAGAPVSMVKPNAPDFERYPRYRDALAAALTAELEPGDAVYIPYMWWHGVESLTPFNMLCNFWWNDHRPAGSPFDAMMHAFVIFASLPQSQRAIWRGMFDRYVFRTDGNPLDHLPPEHRGALGGLDAAGSAAMKKWIAQNLMRG